LRREGSMPKNVMMGDVLEAAVLRYDLDRQALVDWVWNCRCGGHRKRRYEDVQAWGENAQAGVYGGAEGAVKALEDLLNAPRPWEKDQPERSVMIEDGPRPDATFPAAPNLGARLTPATPEPERAEPKEAPEPRDNDGNLPPGKGQGAGDAVPAARATPEARRAPKPAQSPPKGK
jgi:hypothetical protein